MFTHVRTPLTVLLVSLALARAGVASDRRPMTVDDVLGLRRAGDLQLSPDGTRVAFAVREWNRGEDRFDTHIHVADLASGRSAQATASRASEWRPRWSPEGTLAFLSDRDGPAAV